LFLAYALAYAAQGCHISIMTETSPLRALRDTILDAALQDVPFDGWTQKVIDIAGEKTSTPADELALAFPEGIQGLLAFYSRRGDEIMLERLASIESPTKIRKKITLCVRERILADAQNRPAAQRAAAALSLPGRQSLALLLNYETLDAMWRWAGDSSTDYNFYTKRMTLGAVVTSTRLFWFSDDSDDYEDTWEFLDRRIENVMQFEKAKAKFKTWKSDKKTASDLIGQLAKWRFRDTA